MSRFTTIPAAMLMLGLFLPARYSPSSAAVQETGRVPREAQGIAEEDHVALFTEANQHYKDEDYSQAARGYTKLILSGLRNGPMYYNLGNSYFKLGALGKAILSYRLAELYLPRDQDLKANLAYAREMTKDKIESRQLTSFISEFCFWYTRLNLQELMIFFLCGNFLCWAIAFVRLWVGGEFWRYLFLTILTLAAVLGVSLGFKVYHTYYSAGAVVTTREVSVRAGNGLSATPLFQLHDGAECTIIEQENDWVKIDLADGKRGWIESQWLGRCLVTAWPPESG